MCCICARVRAHARPIFYPISIATISLSRMGSFCDVLYARDVFFGYFVSQTSEQWRALVAAATAALFARRLATPLRRSSSRPSPTTSTASAAPSASEWPLLARLIAALKDSSRLPLTARRWTTRATLPSSRASSTAGPASTERASLRSRFAGTHELAPSTYSLSFSQP